MSLSKQHQMILVGFVIVVTVILLIVVISKSKTKKCGMVCKNGGILSPDCTSCTCTSPWSGKQCESCGLKCNPNYKPDKTCVNCFFQCPDFGVAVGENVSHVMEALPQQHPDFNFQPISEGSMTIRNVDKNRVRLWYNKETNLITKTPTCG